MSMILPARNGMRGRRFLPTHPCTKSPRWQSASIGRIGRQRTASGRVQARACSRVSAAHLAGRIVCPGGVWPPVEPDRRERTYRGNAWVRGRNRVVDVEVSSPHFSPLPHATDVPGTCRLIDRQNKKIKTACMFEPGHRPLYWTRIGIVSDQYLSCQPPGMLKP